MAAGARSSGAAGEVLAQPVALWELHNPPATHNPLGLIGLPYRLASPGAAIGLALLVLACAERSRAVLLLTLA
jgi:hypothetical protein